MSGELEERGGVTPDEAREAAHRAVHESRGTWPCPWAEPEDVFCPILANLDLALPSLRASIEAQVREQVASDLDAARRCATGSSIYGEYCAGLRAAVVIARRGAVVTGRSDADPEASLENPEWLRKLANKLGCWEPRGINYRLVLYGAAEALDAALARAQQTEDERDEWRMKAEVNAAAADRLAVMAEADEAEVRWLRSLVGEVRRLDEDDLGTCDWGCCNGEAVASRSSEFGWLPVCRVHVTDDSLDERDDLRAELAEARAEAELQRGYSDCDAETAAQMATRALNAEAKLTEVQVELAEARAENERLGRENEQLSFIDWQQRQDWLVACTERITVERDALAVTVRRVEARLDEVRNVREYGQRGSTFYNGASQLERRIRAALAAVSSEPDMTSSAAVPNVGVSRVHNSPITENGGQQ